MQILSNIPSICSSLKLQQVWRSCFCKSLSIEQLYVCLYTYTTLCQSYWSTHHMHRLKTHGYRYLHSHILTWNISCTHMLTHCSVHTMRVNKLIIAYLHISNSCSYFLFNSCFTFRIGHFLELLQLLKTKTKSRHILTVMKQKLVKAGKKWKTNYSLPFRETEPGADEASSEM